MKLFEITNGFTGESYVRCYAWAQDSAVALTLARQQFFDEENRKPNPRPRYWENLQIVELFDDSAPAFATQPCDDGWPEREDTTA